MLFEQTFEAITRDLLLERVRALKSEGHRLVQIGATRLADELQLTYSFDREGQLLSLRLQLPATDANVPSITSIFWGAFLYENELHDLFGVDVQGIAVDFHGTLYLTTVKFPFGSTKAPSSPKGPLAPVIAGNGVPPTPPLTGANRA